MPGGYHVASGIEAVVESANVVTRNDIWVDVPDVEKAVETVEKLTGERPEVYTGDRTEGCVCICLRE